MPRNTGKREPRGRMLGLGQGSQERTVKRVRVKARFTKCGKDGAYTNGKNTIFLKKGDKIPPGYGRIAVSKYSEFHPDHPDKK